VVLVVGASIVGALTGAAVVFAGPKKTVVCAEASWPDSMFGDIFGHVDGPTSTGCVVPGGLTWMIALFVLFGFVAVGAVAARSLRRYSPNDEYWKATDRSI